MRVRIMPAETVVKLLKQFRAVGIRVWIDGGWAVDALLGQQTRAHGDLDIVVQKQDVEKARHILESGGYQNKVDADTKPWNFVMRDNVGHEVDLHVIEFDDRGAGIYGPHELGLSYPVGSLTGRGVICDYRVSCISPEWLVGFHVGYEIDNEDVHDVMALHERFRVALPFEYLSAKGQAADTHEQDENCGVNFVEFIPKDLPEEARVILGAALYLPTPEKINTLLTTIYASTETRLFGIAVGKSVVAVMGLRLDRQSAAEILHIAVGEGYRGKGYGRSLVELVETAE